MADRDLTQEEVEAKIAKINDIVRDFVKEMSDIKQQKQSVIQQALQRIDHNKIQNILNEINKG